MQYFQAFDNERQSRNTGHLRMNILHNFSSEDSMTVLWERLQNIMLLHSNLHNESIDGIKQTISSRQLYENQLQSLSLLSRYDIGPDGAAALACRFKFWKVLQKLDLSHNNIGPEGTIALADGFKFLTALQKLDLSHNKIGPDGATL